jgi:hypothetical protein
LASSGVRTSPTIFDSASVIFLLMALLKLQINGKAMYEGASIAVPRAGEDIHHDGQVVRIEAVVWDFSGADAVVP